MLNTRDISTPFSDYGCIHTRARTHTLTHTHTTHFGHENDCIRSLTSAKDSARMPIARSLVRSAVPLSDTFRHLPTFISCACRALRICSYPLCPEANMVVKWIVNWYFSHIYKFCTRHAWHVLCAPVSPPPMRVRTRKRAHAKTIACNSAGLPLTERMCIGAIYGQQTLTWLTKSTLILNVAIVHTDVERACPRSYSCTYFV